MRFIIIKNNKHWWHNPLARKIILLTVIIHVLAIYPFFYLNEISWQLWFWFIFWYTFSSLGVTVGLHRFFTHKSFKTKKITKQILGLMAISSLRGTIDFWVGMHRSHHRYSDRTDEKSHLDPYNAGFGFWNGYLGWALKVENKEDFYNYFKKYAQDLTLDPDLKYFNKMGIDLYFNIFLGFITYLMFGFLGLSMILGLRLTLMHQAVYLTNSIGHGHGPLNYRNFDTKDLSSNNWFLSIIAWGDGWHNNHHAFPSSAKNTYKFWEIDPSYWFISLLEKIGIANDVNTGIDDLT